MSELVFFWALFGIVALLTFLIMSPYLTPLFLAGVFTVLFSPIYERLLRWMKGRTGYAALATVLVVLCVILIPLIFLGILLSEEVLAIYGNLSEGNATFAIVDNMIATLQSRIQQFIPTFVLNANVYAYLETALQWIGAHLNVFFTGILSFIFQTLIIIVAMFFFYRDGKKLRAFALKWSPLADEYDAGILNKLEIAISSVVKGALTTAIAQGVMVGIGFTIFGIPNPVLWGVIATIAALIPFFGTGLVTMPAAFWLLFIGHTNAGVGLLIWGLGCVGLIDNVLNPYMMNKGIDVHPFLILLSIFGGLAYFGPVGFLAGPITLAFFFALLEVYPLIIKGHMIKNDDGK